MQSLFLTVMDHDLATLVPSQLAFVPHYSMRGVFRARPGIAEAFWRDSLINAAVFREWMVGLGRRTATQRIARLLCEMERRYRAVGLSHGHSYELPVTQTELGDTTGLSSVHVNRVIQDLRREGLITFQGSRVTIEDPDRLAKLGGFDPTYLHLRRDKPA